MSRIEIYMEGGGDDDQRRGMLRTGMEAFLGELKTLAREKLSWQFSVVCCGGRDRAFEYFEAACKENEDDKVIVLLVDSEKPVIDGISPREHLNEETDGKFDGTPDDLVHLMVQIMETWIISDPDALQQYYGDNFLPEKLPLKDNMEEVTKGQINMQLKAATRKTQPRKYHKIRHATDLLKLIDPDLVRSKCHHCNHFFVTLERLIDERAAA